MIIKRKLYSFGSVALGGFAGSSKFQEAKETTQGVAKQDFKDGNYLKGLKHGLIGVSKKTAESYKNGTYGDKQFSSREKVPSDIAKEGKKSGVIQKDKNGVWRIISYKTNPPEFWDAHYDTREDAEKALDAYHANKGK